MYGCVTNGYEWCFLRWCFLRLENQMVQIDTKRLFLNELEYIYFIFKMVIESYEN